MAIALDDLMFKPGLMKGQRILITGGGTGLGKVMAEGLLMLGAEVYICGRRGGVLEDAAKELMDAGYVAEEEARVTRGWRRLQELPTSGLPIIEYPLPEVRDGAGFHGVDLRPAGVGPAEFGDSKHQGTQLGVGRIVVEGVDPALEGPEQFIIVQFPVGDADDAAAKGNPLFVALPFVLDHAAAIPPGRVLQGREQDL